MTASPPLSAANSALAVPTGPLLVDILVQAYRTTPREIVLLRGRTGVGKSEIVEQAAAVLDVDVQTIDLSILEPTDLTGLPFIEDRRTHYAPPEALPADGAGILLVEEFGRAERQLRNPMVQFLTGRTLNSFRLGKGWMFVLVTNPDDEGNYDVDPLDDALIDRCLTVQVVADRRSWLRWAEAHGTHPTILQLGRTHDGFLEQVSPRSWTRVSDLLLGFDDLEKADEAVLEAMLHGRLPAPWAQQVLEALRNAVPGQDFDLELALGDEQELRKAEQSLAAHRQAGRTDRLGEVATRLTRLVQGDGLSDLDSRDGFRLEHFEALLGHLQGDDREAVQAAFARNPASLLVVKLECHLEPADVLMRFRQPAISGPYTQWLDDDQRRHRAWSLAWGIPAHLRTHPDLVQLKTDNRVRSAIASLARALGPVWSEPLVSDTQRLGIVPLG